LKHFTPGNPPPGGRVDGESARTPSRDFQLFVEVALSAAAPSPVEIRDSKLLPAHWHD